ncbi:hypothetical protein G7076_10810 [Sphingomonas sp. HDW15A]|uniref:CC_3452 family protein n=1 Tax=Sphingomonas sp. HDW15A TaxID=2714942 RepID=UPI00140A0C86|nr:hypothetical protein [Sphingomonas sp. HDW15A]QIK96851.1 hypothetical protein G7076_10810 [Sphingomonas sp. HDW15A]
MNRLALIAASALFAVPASAGTYTATPASPTADAKVVARDIAWTYAGGNYTGRTAESRPLVLCQGLAKKVGRLNAFTADGRAFSVDELAKCNAFATGGSTAVANAN